VNPPPAPAQIVVSPPAGLPLGLEIERAGEGCLSFRLGAEAMHPELAARLSRLVGELPKPWAGAHRCVFLDLETLGLASAPIFLVGALHVGAGGFHAHQFLAQDYAGETAVLEAAAPLLAAECLVTYNGRSFDWPFLADRRRLHRLAPLPAPTRHLDLLLTARRLYRGILPSCGLDNVEREVLGLERRGEIPGSLIPELYHRAVAEGNLNLLVPVLHHNLVDLVSLACLAEAWREHLTPDR
jgi:uncharacterized protein YprB with RNaseH-like and TPR domain